MLCSICQTRRPKRNCPAVRGEICAICCGEGREETITCPLDCEYLIEAHKHERITAAEAKQWPNRDIAVREETLVKNEALLTELAGAMVRWATDTEGAVDFDVRDALDALTRTYKTLRTGIYYESRPENRVAGGLFTALKQAIDQFRAAEAEETGIHKTRDSDVLELLVFLQQFEIDRNNGRKRGRAFIVSLMDFYPKGAPGGDPDPSPLILP